MKTLLDIVGEGQEIGVDMLAEIFRAGFEAGFWTSAEGHNGEYLTERGRALMVCERDKAAAEFIDPDSVRADA